MAGFVISSCVVSDWLDGKVTWQCHRGNPEQSLVPLDLGVTVLSTIKQLISSLWW